MSSQSFFRGCHSVQFCLSLLHSKWKRFQVYFWCCHTQDILTESRLFLRIHYPINVFSRLVWGAPQVVQRKYPRILERLVRSLCLLDFHQSLWKQSRIPKGRRLIFQIALSSQTLIEAKARGYHLSCILCILWDLMANYQLPLIVNIWIEEP